MNIDFQKIIDQLHDARVFGFLFDNNRADFKFDFYIYVQLFDDFKEESYELRKSLLRFSDAQIHTLSIKNDFSRGQYFISYINVNEANNKSYEFEFVFNSNEIKLNLLATDIEIITSDKIEYSSDQYLETDWTNLTK